MNNLTIKQFVIYIVAVLILFMIPIYTIIINSTTLRNGTEYLFKVEAFDPYDMFRGNYLNINFEENVIKNKHLMEYNKNNEYYVTIDKDSDGFAYFKDISLTKPKNTSDYFKTTAYYRGYSNEYVITTPTRYYMNENKLNTAESMYRENIHNTYVKVRINNGSMVIVGVYINGILIDSID